MGAAVVESIDVPEWWEVAGTRLGGWAQRHRVLVRRAQLFVAVSTWVAIPVVLVALVALPELRPAAATYARNVWLLLVVFWLARPKTVSWALVSAVFSVGLPWALVTGSMSTVATRWVGLTPGTAGSSAGIASTVEETFKLLPLVFLVVVAPGRARRFAAVDWAVLAFSCGLAFNTAEDAARRVYQEVRGPSLADILDLITGHSSALVYSSNPWSSASFETADGAAVAAGHHVWSMLVGAAAGLGIALWRAGAGSRGRPQMAWRAAALLLPAWSLAWVVTDHGAYNAWNSSPAFTETVAGSGFPPVAALAWLLTGQGRLTASVCFGLFVACCLVDAHRRGVAARLARDPAESAASWWLDPDAAAERVWSRVADRVRGRALDAMGALLLRSAFQCGRDVAVIVFAHVRHAGEGRTVAARRGRLAMAMTRLQREVAMRALVPGTEPRSRHLFAAAWGVGGVLVTAVVVFAGLVVAARIGLTLPASNDQGTWFAAGPVPADFAALLDALAGWWDGLGPGGQIAVTAVAVAGIMALGGGFGVALFATGIATYGLAHAGGIADLTRDPRAATRDYLTHATPAGVVADLADFGLTFVPGGAVGGAVGRGSRPAAGAVSRWIGRQLARDAAAKGASVIPRLGSIAEDLGAARLHLSSIPEALDYGPNRAMLKSIDETLASGRALSPAERSFLDHELLEAHLVRNGMTLEEAHVRVHEVVPVGSNFSPDVLRQYSNHFSRPFFEYWGITK